MPNSGNILSHGGIVPQVEEAALVTASSILVGDVRLGKDASVWFAAVLRGDLRHIEIGEESNIQDGCLLHVTRELPVVVGSRVTVGHGAILHGCVIGKGSLVGMGATILDGAVIGEESVVAAGALVPEGKVFPPRSLIMGVPGKVVRQVSDEEAARLQEQARRYVELAWSYREGRRSRKGPADSRPKLRYSKICSVEPTIR